ncbi:MAG: hypothetical protein QOE96_4042 [Blastocatellia bacterium]|jgi:hypothetical protein|nr:hypothetical protein [Blastocatellia bacterium]
MDIRHREAHLDLKRHQLPSDLRRSQRRLRLRPLLLRGLIRLVRDELGDKQYKRENIFYRDLNRRLSKVRDTAALAESLSKLEERFAEELTENAFASVRRYLKRATRKRQAEKKRALVHVRKKIIAARKRVKKWSIKNDNVSVAGPGLNQIYSQGRAGFSKAYKKQSVARCGSAVPRIGSKR